MKPIVPTVLVLLLVGSASLSGLVPAYADDPAPAAAPSAAAPAAPSTPAGPSTLQAVPAPQGNPAPQAAPGAQTPATQQAAPAQRFNRDWRQQANGYRQGGAGSFGAGPFGFGRFGGGLGMSVLGIGCGDRGAEALEIAFVRIQYEVKPTSQQQPLFDALKTAALAGQKNYADACRAAISSLQSQDNRSVLDRFSARLALETARVNALNDVLPKFRSFFDSLTDQQKAAFAPRRMGFTGNGGMGNGGMGNGGMGQGMGGFRGWRDQQGGANGQGGPMTFFRLQRPGGTTAPATPPADPRPDASETPA
ncbi:MAG TPA: hypothetical protein VHB74_11165 [Devosia sp.]|nr:hypothetical protein [Devosia sp.]